MIAQWTDIGNSAIIPVITGNLKCKFCLLNCEIGIESCFEHQVFTCNLINADKAQTAISKD